MYGNTKTGELSGENWRGELRCSKTYYASEEDVYRFNDLIVVDKNGDIRMEREYRIKVTISLDDDCHNNMCDWSITADIRWKNEYGIYKEYMGGCCHDEIAKHCPELAKFIPLHCCNHYKCFFHVEPISVQNVMAGGSGASLRRAMDAGRRGAGVFLWIDRG